jgi:hypothetical protein
MLRIFPLERLAEVAYSPRMADHPDHAELTPPQEWLDALARSEADLAAGRVVSGEGLMRRLRQTLAEMQARPIREAIRSR